MIRPFRQEDADEVWELKRQFELTLGRSTGTPEKATAYEAKLEGSYERGYREWVERCIEAQPDAIHVAERSGDLVGYVFVLPETFAYVWDAAVLNEIFVAEEHRGTGLADDLLEAALDVARDQDLPMDRLVLDVDPDNDRATGFYERWGFEPWGTMVARDL
ncbi:MAG: N-acetyltransferase family protein [Halanaeroarchaeum sp.]